MKIIYIHHDGFSVDLEDHILLFDYWDRALPAFDQKKKLYVFASHSHPDHFSFSVFEKLKSVPYVRYLLANDIHRKFNRNAFLSHGVSPEAYEKITFVRAGERIDIDDLKTETLSSTDEGVAFLVTCEGKSFYHAGDLNDWSFEKNDAVTNLMEEHDYRRILEGIRGRHFDAAFVPLDPRQGIHYSKGLDYFMRNTDTDEVCPMHCWDDPAIVARLLKDPVSEPYRGKIRNPEDFKSTAAAVKNATDTPAAHGETT